MSNKGAYHHITQLHDSCFILLAAQKCIAKDCDSLVTQEMCSLRIVTLSQSYGRNALVGTAKNTRAVFNVQMVSWWHVPP